MPFRRAAPAATPFRLVLPLHLFHRCGRAAPNFLTVVDGRDELSTLYNDVQRRALNNSGSLRGIRDHFIINYFAQLLKGYRVGRRRVRAEVLLLFISKGL